MTRFATIGGVCRQGEDHMMAVSHAEYAALVEERDRLKAILDHIAESVIVCHFCLPSTPIVQGCCQTTWGCGICHGEFHREPERYDHTSWCPRRKSA